MKKVIEKINPRTKKRVEIVKMDLGETSNYYYVNKNIKSSKCSCCKKILNLVILVLI